MQGDADNERGVKDLAPDWPTLKRGLDVLVVELGRTEGCDGGRGIRRREAVR